ncbi:hypothetical protein [Paraburkholderia sp. BL10I2N1]|uniref:hypothetical protein n=1 Tax=Paraburkholderia sp. BL10I2N1 TaxID=1938796 RepID=UPI0010D48BE0|nr:hypothetical protein [Paraburkholderia sp. BL10I2N1]TDN58883.1 hypothetical protein B0G77_8054 [Paraburkholderia sp. BL10I2N1]
MTTILIAATAIIATPAFASGYGPAPHYRPTEGAPASQRGVSTQTMAAEQAARNGTDKPDRASAVQASAAQAAETVEAGQ